MTVPLVSVVVPTFNRAAYLRQALASIRALEGEDLRMEILVADNGSTDNTREVAAEFGARFLQTSRRGAAATRNLGLKHATGEFVAFLDDDDVWCEGHLWPQIAFLNEHPDYSAVVGQAVLVDQSLDRIWGPFPYELPEDGRVYAHFLRDYPQIGATVVRTAVLKTVGGFNERLIGDQDWDWHLRLARTCRVGFVPVESVLFRQRPPGSQDALQRRRLRFMHRVLLANAIPALRSGIPPHTFLRIYASHCGRFFRYFRDSAGEHSARGEHGDARKALAMAFVASPMHAVAGLVRDGDWRSNASAVLAGR